MKSDIVLQNVHKQYDGNIVLNEFNALIPYGKTTCIMGTSGGGKTTLLNLILGLEKADNGTIQGILEYKCAAVFQEDRLCEEFDAITNIKLVTSPDVTTKRIKEEFKKVNLEEYENKPCCNLSGGMKRRVAIVRAMLAESDLIVLDEPLKGFDEQLKERMMKYLKSSLVGKTAIIVIHEKEDALLLGDKLIEI